MHTAHYLVCYGDTDQMGVVYYANYLRIFEFARVCFLRAASVSYRDVERAGLLIPVSEAHVRYLKPAHFEDELLVDTGIVELGHVSALFRYKVRRGDETLALGHTRHACITREGKLTRFPSSFTDLLVVDDERLFAR